MTDERHLDEAIRLAVASAASGGGPFGAVVVDAGGVAMGAGTNRVVADHDPSAHAEVVAMRDAARARGWPDLDGCVLYASCHPCPMCLTAAWWARVNRVVFAARVEDAAAAGFDDERFWTAMGGVALDSIVPLVHVDLPSALEPFDAWARNPDKVMY